MPKQDVKVELFYDGAWQDATADEEVYTREPIEINHGAQDETSVTPPSSASYMLDNPDGKHNPRNPASPIHGIARNLPTRVSLAGDVRFHGEVASWGPRWPIKGRSWSSVSAAGILRRLGQGSPPVRSALHRTLAAAATQPAGYWPMLSPAATAAGLPPMVVADITGSSSPDLSWTTDSSVPVMGDVFTSAGRDIYVRTGPGLPLDTLVVVDSGLRARPTGNTSAFTLSHRIGDFFVNVTANWATGVPTLTLVTNTGTLDTAAATDAARVWDEALHAYRTTLTQDGSDVDITVHMDGVEIMSGTATSVSLAVGGSGTVPGLISAGRAECVWGSLVAWVGAAEAVADIHAAILGWPGETTANRFLRLLAEEGLDGSVSGDPDDCPHMGPQHPDTFVNLLREIEATDDGFVYDLHDDAGLGMRTGRSCWNQDPVLELDWDAFHIAPPTDPVVDDLLTRNDVTAANRRTGAAARAVRESGPLNVVEPADDPEGVGRYTHQVDVNPFSDLVLGDHAGWHVHRGTVDETRWPNVTIDVDGADLDVSTLQPGDRVTIANVPAEITPDLVSLIVPGWSETIESHRRRFTLHAIPEAPLHIAEVEHADYSFVGSDGSTVNTAFVAGTGTSLSVAIAAGYPLWAFESTFDILVSGVRLRVTAIAGASSPQTFTVQAAPINGVTKTLAVGDRVDVFHKSYIGL